jgi:hypothetical protein
MCECVFGKTFFHFAVNFSLGSGAVRLLFRFSFFCSFEPQLHVPRRAQSDRNQKREHEHEMS